MKLIKFEKQNCAPCVLVSNYLEDLEVEYEKVDVEEAPELAIDFGVMSTPTTFLVDEENNVIARSRGFNPNELEEMINKLN